MPTIERRLRHRHGLHLAEARDRQVPPDPSGSEEHRAVDDRPAEIPREGAAGASCSGHQPVAEIVPNTQPNSLAPACSVGWTARLQSHPDSPRLIGNGSESLRPSHRGKGRRTDVPQVCTPNLYFDSIRTTCFPRRLQCSANSVIDARCITNF